MLFDKSMKLRPLYTFDGVEGHYQADSDAETRSGMRIEKPETMAREM